MGGGGVWRSLGFKEKTLGFKEISGFLGNHLDLGPAFGEILSKNLIRIRVSKTQIDIKMVKT